MQRFRVNNNRILYIFAGSFALFIAGFFVLNFLHPFSPETSNAATDTTSGTYNGTSYSLTTAVSDLNLELDNVTPASKAVYGKQTINVTTNAPGGYQLYMQTSGNLVGTKEGVATSDSIAALSSNNAALDMNTWGYTKTVPNEDYNTAASQSIWNTPPTTITQVDSTSSAAASGRDTDIYYGIKADNSLDGDNYSGTIAYTTVASDVTSTNESTNGLVVSPTSGTAGAATTLTITTPLMTTASLTASDITATVGSYTCTSITITSQAPLTFTCSVTVSAAGTYDVTTNISKYSITYTKSSAFTSKPSDITGANMQSSNIATLCKNSTETTSASNYKTYELTDLRDSQKYFVRKFKFNNAYYCIMVENLALAGGTTLASSTSNISTNASWSLPSSSASNFSGSGGKSKRMYNGASTAATSRKRNGATYDGSYYNWCAVTAGTGGCYNTSKAAGAYDICPKYWRLPTHTEAGYIGTKINSIGINTFFANASGTTADPIYSGYYDSSSLINGRSEAHWWSSTQVDAYSSNSSYVYGGSLATESDTKYLGFSVRCLVQAAS